MNELGPAADHRLGAFLFRHRGVMPVPLILVAAALARGPGDWLPGGLALVGAGEALRLWGVAHIGSRSRTRGEGVGNLVTTGPFAICRNPLYVGNLAMLTGLGLLSGRGWVGLLVLLPMTLHYQLIVGWEESRLLATHGSAWESYAARVGRWFGPAPDGERAPGQWRAALRSERSTLLSATASVCGVLAAGWWLAG